MAGYFKNTYDKSPIERQLVKDHHINFAQMLLHQQFPEVERLLSKKETTTEETCEWPLKS